MHEAEKYNGWSNRETWLANLWLNNDESSYDVLCRAIDVDGSLFDKADWLEEQLRYQLDDEIDVPCLWQDLLQTAFGRISWSELIESNLE
jgi:hypothetical protein